MTVTELVILLARVAAGALAGAFIITSYRWIAARSRVIGALVALAILVRAALGVTMFAVSWFGLPIARSLQAGNGFWNIALDATGYYQIAAAVASAHTLLPLTHSVPAPVFVDVLTIWMLVVGISPAAGMFLNLVLYTLLMRLLVYWFGPVNDWRRDLPGIVTVAAFSFAPVILFHSTQPLKDELTIFCGALASLGVLGLRRLLQGLATRRQLALAAGAAATTAAAIFGMSGIRWYFGAIILGSVGLALGAAGLVGRRTPIFRYAGATAVVLLLGLVAFHGSSGPYFPAAIGTPSNLWKKAEVARAGFLLSGGASNVVVSLNDPLTGLQRETELMAALRSTHTDDEQVVSIESLRAALSANSAADAARGIPVTTWQQVRTILAGLAIVCLPAKIIAFLLNVHIPGGRGLLMFADVDTLFLDVMTIAVVVLLWTRRRTVAQGHVMLIYAVILSAITAVLLGYVVTNFGTLWRMRPMVVTPLWLLPLLLSPSAVDVEARTTAEQGLTAPAR